MEVVDLNSYRETGEIREPRTTAEKQLRAIERVRDDFDGIDTWLHDTINDFFDFQQFHHRRAFKPGFRESVYTAFHRAADLPAEQKLAYANPFINGYEQKFLGPLCKERQQFEVRRLSYVRSIVEERFVNALDRERKQGRAQQSLIDYNQWRVGMLALAYREDSQDHSVAETLRDLSCHERLYYDLVQPRRYATSVARDITVGFAAERTSLQIGSAEEIRRNLELHDRERFLQEASRGLHVSQLIVLAGAATSYGHVDASQFERSYQEIRSLPGRPETPAD